MPEIKPFNAVRYSKSNITDFICPPYDVISAEDKEKLKKLSDYNIVNIELPDASGKQNKYRHAAALFKNWLQQGVLERGEKPSFYFYEQFFEDKGVAMTRRGFFAALKLENPHSGKGAVKPHEKTLAKPKADRLSLLKAVKANVSPIFGLFDDNNLAGVKLCKNIAKRAPQATAKDKDGFHKLWVVSDEETTDEIVKLLSDKKMFIADGHHRYETAWNYSLEMKAKDKKYSAGKDYNYVMAFLCPMEDPGISIWPTHRVISEPKDLEERIAKYFDVHPAKDFEKLSKKEIQPMMVYKDGKYRTLTIKSESILKKAMPDKCKAYRNLAVSALHYVLIPSIDAQEFTYVKKDTEAVALAKKTNTIAVIVPATPVEALKAISLSNQMMPQKSTYFYPKLASGIVMRTV
ncbi:MAG: DUF1015 domain-containing protein [Endomicrobia bacterium]|nr:DUF1015 domain-containing protein [Endomicrobiia bacterium]